MSAPNKWRRVRVCPVCGHRGFCTVSEDVVKCMRMKSDKPVEQKDGQTGWLHPLPDGPAGAAAKKLPATTYHKPLTHSEVAAMLKQHRTAVNPERLAKFSKSIGLSIRSLKAYGIGWDSQYGAWSFPMFDGSADSKGRYKACGIRLRKEGGKKLCVPGSRNGLFIPDNIFDVEELPDVLDASSTSPLLILMPEGPTDAAAAMDLGFRAIGRPSNSGGSDEIVRMLITRKCQEVVLVADRDPTKYLPDGTPYWPGIEGAMAVARKLYAMCKPLRFLMPPDGKKDLREWLPTANPLDLGLACATAPIVTRQWIEAADKRLVKKRELERKPSA